MGIRLILDNRVFRLARYDSYRGILHDGHHGQVMTYVADLMNDNQHVLTYADDYDLMCNWYEY